MISRFARSRWFVGLGMLFLTGFLPLAMQSVHGLRPRDWLLAHWRQQLALEIGNPQLAKRRLEQIASLDEDGLPTLVEGLTNYPESVAVAALDVLSGTLDRWQTLTTAEASSKVACLARVLANRAASVPPARHRHLADLAARLLVWPVDRQVVDVAQLVADCETAIREVSRRTGKDAVPAAMAAGSVTSRRGSESPARSMVPPLLLEVPSPDFPGGGLSVEAVEIPYLPRTPLEVAEMEKAETPISLETALLTLPSSRTWSSPNDLTLAVPGSDRQAARASGPSLAVPANSPDASPDLALMHDLVSPEATVAAAAAERLRRRGYLPVHLELARRLVDPEPAVRLALVEALPQLSRIDARPWLAWLSHDSDVLVRKAAIAVIATSCDAALRDQLRGVEGKESDPEVLRLVRSVLYDRRPE